MPGRYLDQTTVAPKIEPHKAPSGYLSSSPSPKQSWNTQLPVNYCGWASCLGSTKIDDDTYWSGCFLCLGEDQPCWCLWSDNHTNIPSLTHSHKHTEQLITHWFMMGFCLLSQRRIKLHLTNWGRESKRQTNGQTERGGGGTTWDQKSSNK